MRNSNPAGDESAPVIPRGLRYMAMSAFYFSLMSLLVKLAGRRLPSSELVMARSFVALVLSYVMLRRIGVSPWGNNRRLLIFRGLVGFGGLFCFFYAITKLPLEDVTVIQYTNPVFVALFAAIFLKERLNASILVSILVSLIGVAFIAQPSFIFGTTSTHLDPVAVGVAMGGALFAAVAYTTVRKLGETEHPLVVVFYFPLIATPIALPVMAPDALWPTPVEWLMLIGIGVVTQIAQVYMTKGLHAERAGRATSVTYIQIVFAAIWGMLVFGEYPDPLSIVGALLVMGGIVLVTRSRAE